MKFSRFTMLARSFAIMAVLLFGGLTNTEATLMKYLEVEEMARLSTNVVRGKVVGAKVYWDASHTRILTDTHLAVSESLKGSITQGAQFVVTQLGGELDGIKMDYNGRPVFQFNEEVVVFTRNAGQNQHTVIGLKQGKLIVKANAVHRDLSGITFTEASTKNTATQNASRPVRAMQTRYSLVELRERIARTR